MDLSPLRLTENIHLLERLRNKPIPRTANRLINTSNDNGRQLSLRKELEIVEDLTYLSVYSNDPADVMALCIEEQANHEGMIVSIATNTGPSQHLQKGVQSIVDTLANDTDPARNGLHMLLRKTIEHGRSRMESRLGFKNGSNASERLKSSTATLLQRVLTHYCKVHPKARSTLKDLYNLANRFLRQSEQYNKSIQKSRERSLTDSILLSIISTASEIWKLYREDIIRILSRIANDAMDPSTKESMMYRLGCLAQYVSAAEMLLKYAVRFSVFKAIKVRLVSLAACNLSQIINKANNQTPRGLLNRHLHASATSQRHEICPNIPSILQWRKMRLTNEAKAIDEQIVRYANKNEYKVHAEIQLIIEYERRPHVTYPPRILKSSKSACFLCDLFIRTHGKFNTPKTHGKVYDRWMLPSLDGLGIPKRRRKDLICVFERFNDAVEEVVLKVAKKQGEKQFDNPRESDLFSHALSTTLLSASDESLSTIRPSRNHSLSNVLEVTTRPDPRKPDPNGEQELADTQSMNQRTLGAPSNTSSARSESNSKLRPGSSSAQIAGSTHQAHSVGSLVLPLTSVMPMLHKLHSLAKSHSASISESPTPESGPSSRAERISHLKEVRLQPGVPYIHAFDSSFTVVWLITSGIHIELSRSFEDLITSQECFILPESNGKVISVESTWLERTEAERGNFDEGFVVDLEEAIEQVSMKEGVLFGRPGLLLRKAKDIVRLKARYTHG
ncbi:hypothetical protein CC78DRAFT_573757 [Lojkania enalia]|uniref:Uncharacterized protein n=1 Tax=Lojkania enalia TaxID=147567 RepID=A0A9P4NC94_9PLEO|nr:hypothetical protein CC78DRAFT_573757 [Didymosphaeria enalia]